MGAIASRPVLHNIETALLSVAQLIDTVVRAFEYLLSVIISKCVHPSIYRHFYVSTPTSVNAADLNEADKEGLTRICTNEGVCYIPATRLEQHRQLRKQKQDDRLKKRKMRAEWAAAGLNVDEMAREERRKEKQRKQKTNNKANESYAENEEKKNKLSRTSTADDQSTQPVLLSEKSTKEEKPLYVMGNVPRRSADIKRNGQQNKTEHEANQEQDTHIHWAKSHRTSRPLTAVREASNDHGAIVDPPKFRARLSQDGKGLPNGMADVFEMNEVSRGKEQKERKRQNSVPSPPRFHGKKSQPSVEAVSASRIASNVQDIKSNSVDNAHLPNEFQRGHRPSASLPPLMTSTTALRSHNISVPISPALIQPKPRRAIDTNFEGGSPLFAPPSLHSPAITAGSLRSAATPPPAFLNRNRNSIDLANAAPISRGGTPSDNDASSIRSKRSVTTTSTPPPYVVHLADKACKSRWESTAKERKGWKGEVKRIALNKVHEQRTAHRSSVSLPLNEKKLNQ